jgi:hypothetical protein
MHRDFQRVRFRSTVSSLGMGVVVIAVRMHPMAVRLLAPVARLIGLAFSIFQAENGVEILPGI